MSIKLKESIKDSIKEVVKCWGYDKETNIKLLSLTELKSLKKGEMVYYIGGKILEVGKDEFDLETSIGGKTKYGIKI